MGGLVLVPFRQFCWLWVILGGCGQFWPILDGCCLLVVLATFRWLWEVVRFWVALGGYG